MTSPITMKKDFSSSGVIPLVVGIVSLPLLTMLWLNCPGLYGHIENKICLWGSFYNRKIRRTPPFLDTANDAKSLTLDDSRSTQATKWFSRFSKYFCGFQDYSQITTYFRTCIKVLHGSDNLIRICNIF